MVVASQKSAPKSPPSTHTAAAPPVAAPTKKPAVDRAEAQTFGFAAMAAKLAPPAEERPRAGGGGGGGGRALHLMESHGSSCTATIDGVVYRVEYGWDLVKLDGSGLTDLTELEAGELASSETMFDMDLLLWAHQQGQDEPWADKQAFEADFRAKIGREAPRRFRKALGRNVNATARLMPIELVPLTGPGSLGNTPETGPKRAVKPFVGSAYNTILAPARGDQPSRMDVVDSFPAWDLVGPKGGPLVVPEAHAVELEWDNEQACLDAWLDGRDPPSIAALEAEMKVAIDKALRTAWSTSVVGDHKPVIRWRPFNSRISTNDG